MKPITRKPKSSASQKSRVFLLKRDGGGSKNGDGSLLFRDSHGARHSIAAEPTGVGSHNANDVPAMFGSDPLEKTDGASHYAADCPLASRRAICEQLRELQSNRVVAVRMCLRIENAFAAMVRRAMGFRTDLPDKERAKIRKRASALMSAMKSGGAIKADAPIAKALSAMFIATTESLKPYEAYREALERDMRTLVESLPAYDWIKTIRGAGSLGLAIIVGESGDLSNYPNHRHLWKRLGLAPPEAYRKPTLDGDTKLLVPRRRRSSIWTIADSLLKASGEYADIYKARKQYEVDRHPEFAGKDTGDGKLHVKMHCHRRAARFTEKLFIRDLWMAWTGNKPQPWKTSESVNNCEPNVPSPLVATAV